MDNWFILGTIFIISFLGAFQSMGDLDFGREIRKFIERRKGRGAIVFFKDGIKHYSSSSS